MRRFLRRAAIGILIFLGVIGLLLVAIYLEENWRGARAWKACREQLEARGEVLDLRQFLSDQKPENDLNKVPIFAEADRLLDLPDTRPPPRLMKIDLWLGAHGYIKYIATVARPENPAFLETVYLPITFTKPYAASTLLRIIRTILDEA